jgi:hypothetical protein
MEKTPSKSFAQDKIMSRLDAITESKLLKMPESAEVTGEKNLVGKQLVL